jgi:hypothetical protein
MWQIVVAVTWCGSSGGNDCGGNRIPRIGRAALWGARNADLVCMDVFMHGSFADRVVLEPVVEPELDVSRCRHAPPFQRQTQFRPPSLAVDTTRSCVDRLGPSRPPVPASQSPNHPLVFCGSGFVRSLCGGRSAVSQTVLGGYVGNHRGDHPSQWTRPVGDAAVATRDHGRRGNRRRVRGSCRWPRYVDRSWTSTATPFIRLATEDWTA